MAKKKITKEEIDKITKEVSSNGSLIHFFFVTALELEKGGAKKTATTLMSIYTMGKISGLGYEEEIVVDTLMETELKKESGVN